jgi:hypothetical protein
VRRARAAAPGGAADTRRGHLADAALAEHIEAIHEAEEGICGAPRIQAELAYELVIHVVGRAVGVE